MNLNQLKMLTGLAGAGLMVVGLAAASAPALALTAKECSEKYNAAKASGTLAGKSWNAFRKSECAAGAAPAAVAPATPAPSTTAPAADATAKSAPKVTVPSAAPAKPAPAAKQADAPKATAPAAATGGPSFPTAISAAFAKEKPHKARMHTCLEQYKANKAAGTLGGLKWIQKGGGYYSQCNKRLKGQ